MFTTATTTTTAIVTIIVIVDWLVDSRSSAVLKSAYICVIRLLKPALIAPHKTAKLLPVTLSVPPRLAPFFSVAFVPSYTFNNIYSHYCLTICLPQLEETLSRAGRCLFFYHCVPSAENHA